MLSSNTVSTTPYNRRPEHSQNFGCAWYNKKANVLILFSKLIKSALRTNQPTVRFAHTVCAQTNAWEQSVQHPKDGRNVPGFLVAEARLEGRHAVLDDEGAEEDGQEPHVLNRLVAHQSSEQEPEDDGKRRL